MSDLSFVFKRHSTPTRAPQEIEYLCLTSRFSSAKLVSVCPVWLSFPDCLIDFGGPKVLISSRHGPQTGPVEVHVLTRACAGGVRLSAPLCDPSPWERSLPGSQEGDSGVALQRNTPLLRVSQKEVPSKRDVLCSWHVNAQIATGGSMTTNLFFAPIFFNDPHNLFQLFGPRGKC